MELSTSRPVNSTTYILDDVTNTTDNSSWEFGNSTDYPLTVHDIKYDLSVRIVSLYIQIIMGAIGGIMVIVWMWFNRPYRSRVNALILNLCTADLFVIFFGLLPNLIWEYKNREWEAGEVMCRLVKFLMIFATVSSTNMLVVIAIDRHQAIRSPLREPCPVWIMTAIGWGLSVIIAMPMLFVFHTRYHPVEKIIKCENIFRDKPKSHRQAFVTYASLCSFFIPLVILLICYLRIFLKIAQKASESKNSKRQTFKPGKVQLTSTGANSLSKAKIKTLKMTLVIGAAFIICGLPYFIAELIMSYGKFEMLSPEVYGILGGIHAANSAANPYVFLLFNANGKCLWGLKLCPMQTDTPRRTFMYSSASTRSEYSTACGRHQHPVTASIEMSHRGR